MTHQPQPTKRERREAAKAERLAAEQQAAAAEARKKRLGIFGGVLVAAVLIVVAAIALSSTKDSNEPTATPAEIQKLYAGIPQSGSTLGDPRARATMILFEDPQCPVCRAFDDKQLPKVVNDLVRTGKVKIQLKLMTFIGEDSVTASRVLLGAAEQDKMFQAAGNLFAQQGEERSGWVTEQKLRTILGGVSGLDVDKALTAATGPAPGKALADAKALSEKFKLPGTPGVYIGRSESDLQEVPANADAIAETVNKIAG